MLVVYIVFIGLNKGIYKWYGDSTNFTEPFKL